MATGHTAAQIRCPACLRRLAVPVELTVSGRCTGVITMDTSVVHAHIAECPGPGSGPLKPGGNAEDCPRCTDPNPPYPFLCPGHPALEPGATW